MGARIACSTSFSDVFGCPANTSDWACAPSERAAWTVPKPRMRDLYLRCEAENSRRNTPTHRPQAQPNDRAGTAMAPCLQENSDRKITARLPRRCPRQVERRIIADYSDFTGSSDFRADRSASARAALVNAYWRGWHARAREISPYRRAGVSRPATAAARRKPRARAHVCREIAPAADPNGYCERPVWGMKSCSRRQG